MTRIRFTKLHPLPDYTGPQPVYRVSFPWAGGTPCYVRRNGKVWETAVATTGLSAATFTACPVGDASSTRYNAVMAFDYYHSWYPGRK